MTITWGSVDNHLRVGIDITQSPATVVAGTSSVTLTIKYYVGNDSLGWDFTNDNQLLTLSGAVTGSVSYSCNLSSVFDQQLVATRTLTVATSYAAAVSRTFVGTVSGAYNGATPTKSRNWDVLRRPYDLPSAPSNPSTVLSNITTTSITTNWTQPSDWGGLDTDDYVLEISTSPTFASGVTTITVTNASTYTIGGLTPATQYYMRVAGNNGGTGNGGGIGAFSGTVGFVTAGVPFTPASASVVSHGETTADFTSTVASSTGTAGNAPTSMSVEVDTSPSFTSPVSFSGTVAGVSATGLTPGTTYYARVKYVNSYGESAPLATTPASFTTDSPTVSPMFVKVAGTWHTAAQLWVKVAGTWRPVSRLWVKVGGTWR